MGVLEQINNDLKQAQKDRNELVVSALRVLRAEFMNLAISKMKKELTEEEALAVIKTQVKRLKEAALDFERGNRPDLSEKNEKEIAVLSKYLPAELGEEEIRQAAAEVLAAGSYQAQDFGKAMGEVMRKLQGRADGRTVSNILKEMLK